MRAARLLSSRFVLAHPTDAAPVLERLPTEEVSALLEDLPTSTAAAGLQSMEATVAARCLAGVDGARAVEILEAVRADVAATILLRMSPQEREGLLVEMPAKLAGALRKRLELRAGTAGAVADSQMLALPDRVSAEQALDRLRQPSPRSHQYIYIVDREDRLLGVVTPLQLLSAPPRELLGSLMQPPAARLPASASHAAIVSSSGWHDAHELPVVDDAGRLIGVVGHDLLRRLWREGGAGASPKATSSVGLAFADLCWVGMARITEGLAEAILRPAEPGKPFGGD